MSTPKCVKCKLPTKKATINKIFMDKYVVSDTTVYVCDTCGEEYLDEQEYSRILAKVQSGHFANVIKGDCTRTA